MSVIKELNLDNLGFMNDPDNGFYTGANKCPTCNALWSAHSGNICNFSSGVWPIEDILRIKKDLGKVFPMDKILTLIFGTNHERKS